MKILAIITIFLFLPNIAFSQEKLLKDLDNDGIKDSIYIDADRYTIICRLSTQNFEIITSKPIEALNYPSGVKETKNGFEFFNDWMRAGYKNQFRYNPKTKKIQLIGMSRYEFGNAVNDGSGESSVNLLTGAYIGNWNYYEMEKDKLVSIPTMRTKINLKVIDLEDFSEDAYFEYAEKCVDLYHQHKKK